MKTLFRKRKKESRAIDATDAVIERLLARAAGLTSDPQSLGVSQAAAAIYARCFAAAAIEPGGNDGVFTDLDCVIRSLVLRGESVCIESNGVLIPAASWTVTGASVEPNNWLYDVSLAVPAGLRTTKRQGSELLHFRAGCKPGTPWRGRSPIETAEATADTACLVEDAAAETARLPISNIVGWDTISRTDKTIADDKLGKLMAAFDRRLKTVIRPLTAHTPNIGRLDMLRVDPSAGLNELRRDTNSDLADALGVRGLLGDAEGTAQRESFRQFLFASLEPMARLIEREVMQKIGLDIRFNFDALAAADLTSRGRALKQLVDAGMTLDDALASVGLA